MPHPFLNYLKGRESAEKERENKRKGKGEWMDLGRETRGGGKRENWLTDSLRMDALAGLDHSRGRIQEFYLLLPHWWQRSSIWASFTAFSGTVIGRCIKGRATRILTNSSMWDCNGWLNSLCQQVRLNACLWLGQLWLLQALQSESEGGRWSW